MKIFKKYIFKVKIYITKTLNIFTKTKLRSPTVCKVITAISIFSHECMTFVKATKSDSSGKIYRY